MTAGHQHVPEYGAEKACTQSGLRELAGARASTSLLLEYKLSRPFMVTHAEGFLLQVKSYQNANNVEAKNCVTYIHS